MRLMYRDFTGSGICPSAAIQNKRRQTPILPYSKPKRSSKGEEEFPHQTQKSPTFPHPSDSTYRTNTII